MGSIVVPIPQSLVVKHLITFPSSLASTPHADHYVFDLSRLRWAEPFGMLFCGASLRAFIRDRTASSGGSAAFSANGYGNHPYAAHMGFYQSFGLDYGKTPGEAPGGLHYLPISSIAVSDLRRAARLRPIGEAIAEHADSLAMVLLQGNESAVFPFLSYALLEILRNAVEHSTAPVIWYAAQYYPSLRRVEISILDQGVGIRHTLARNPALRIFSDLHALQLCTQEGVSGVVPSSAEDELHPNEDSWQNAGYGLYVTKELCRRGGSFMICSGNAAYAVWSKGAGYRDTRFTGTALRLVLSIRAGDRLSTALKSIISPAVQGHGRSRSLG